jgi:hypothetical protein
MNNFQPGTDDEEVEEIRSSRRVVCCATRNSELARLAAGDFAFGNWWDSAIRVVDIRPPAPLIE